MLSCVGIWLTESTSKSSYQISVRCVFPLAILKRNRLEGTNPRRRTRQEHRYIAVFSPLTLVRNCVCLFWWYFWCIMTTSSFAGSALLRLAWNLFCSTRVLVTSPQASYTLQKVLRKCLVSLGMIICFPKRMAKQAERGGAPFITESLRCERIVSFRARPWPGNIMQKCVVGDTSYMVNNGRANIFLIYCYMLLAFMGWTT
jgi:hypothetical protein